MGQESFVFHSNLFDLIFHQQNDGKDLGLWWNSWNDETIYSAILWNYGAILSKDFLSDVIIFLVLSYLECDILLKASSSIYLVDAHYEDWISSWAMKFGDYVRCRDMIGVSMDV